jgi:hypothetical protein
MPFYLPGKGLKVGGGESLGNSCGHGVGFCLENFGRKIGALTKLEGAF